MAFTTFFDSKWFSSHLKLRLHITQFILVLLAIVLTGIRIKFKVRPVTRSDTLAIVMGAKSTVVLLYQLLTSHVTSLKKWASLKAYAILNCLEILFWLTVIILAFMGITRSCVGTSCWLGWVIIIVVFKLVFLAVWVSIISVQDWRYFKAHAAHRVKTMV